MRQQCAQQQRGQQEACAAEGLRVTLPTGQIDRAQSHDLLPLQRPFSRLCRQRLIRALEIALYKASHPVTRTAFLPRKTKYIGISVSREERNARIDRRLRERLDAGLVDEVRGLLDRGLSPEDLLYYGLEYKFVTLYLTGALSFDEMASRLQTAIHQFAKRQMTWFRGMERKGIPIEWIPG